MNNLPNSQEALAELAKRELARRHYRHFIRRIHPEYQDGWHIDVIADALSRVERGELKRLIITTPPRHMKSENSSVLFPAWFLGRRSDKEVMTCSYALELAQEFSRKCRDVVRCDAFTSVFPDFALADDSQAKTKWNTTAGGGYSAMGVGGASTGRGADLLIIDDFLKNREEAESKTVKDSLWSWYQSTAFTRLSPDGAIIIVATRWAQDDLIGRILAQPDHGFTVIHLPALATDDDEHRKRGEALWPERWPIERIEDIRHTLSAYEFSALYQGNPLASEHQEFKREWFKSVSEPERNDYAACYLAVDTAMSKKDSADYTAYAMCFVTKDNRWIVKTWHARHDPLELIDTLFGVWAKYRPVKMGIERTAYTDGIKPFLDAEMRKRDQFLPIVELQHGGTAKETRIRSLLPRYQSGAIRHVEGWSRELEDEALTFPRGLHDDVLDATAYLSQLVEHQDDNGNINLQRAKIAQYYES